MLSLNIINIYFIIKLLRIVRPPTYISPIIYYNRFDLSLNWLSMIILIA